MNNTIVNDVERIVKDGLVAVVDGVNYSAANLKKVCDDREPKALVIESLTCLCDLLEWNIDGLNKEELLIVVNDYDGVSLLGKINPESQNRFCYVKVELDKSGKQFPFGQFLDVEDCIIKLQSMFVPSEDLAELIAFVSRLTINNTIQAEDDGCSQSATIVSGISGALKVNQKAPSIVELAPRRTFSGITQPMSKFLFRMKAVEGRVPVCALFEADGGAWRNDAMMSIKSFLTDKTPVKVIA